MFYETLIAAIPPALGMVAIGATLSVGFAWVIEPFFGEPEIRLFGEESRSHDDLLELVDPSLFLDVQWRPAEASARLAVLLSVIVAVGLLAGLQRNPSLHPKQHTRYWKGAKAVLLAVAVAVIFGSAAYPAILVRKALQLAVIEEGPIHQTSLPNFEKPPSLTPAEREAMGSEISPDHPKYVLLVTPAGVRPLPINNCPVHDQPLRVESVPHLPGYPLGHMVRVGFPFGQLVFTNLFGVRVSSLHARRCPECVPLHERYLVLSSAALVADWHSRPKPFDF